MKLNLECIKCNINQVLKICKFCTIDEPTSEQIINDVTFEDAELVGMKDVAEIISNGDGSLGTVLDQVSAEFRDIFHQADLVIAKGQGNFESLSDVDKDHLYFMFMAKCDVVAQAVGVSTGQIVCVKN